MSKTITLDNREKYNKIFSDTVNICLETLMHKDPDNYVDNNKAGGQSKSSTIKINSVEAIKNKDSVSIELIKKKTCPKAIPLKNIWQSSNKINVDKDDDNKVLKRVHQQSSSKCTSGQSEMTQIINMCSSDDDDDEINKKRNNSMTKNHGKSDNEFKKLRPNDNDDSSYSLIHNSNLKYNKLLKAKKKLTINGDKTSKYLIQKKKNIDEINNWVYEKCVEYKNKDLRITDDRLNQLSLKAADKFLPDGDRFRLPIWREQFYKEYNITGKPSDRTMRYFCK